MPHLRKANPVELFSVMFAYCLSLDQLVIVMLLIAAGLLGRVKLESLEGSAILYLAMITFAVKFAARL